MAEAGPLVERESAVSNGHTSVRVARRRVAPGGRALVGGLLVAAAAVGFYAAYTGAGGAASTPVVVAARDLAPGTRLALTDLAAEAADLPPAVQSRSFTDPAVLVGATLVSALHAGELVQASSVVAKASGPAARELTFAVARDAIPPSLEAGEPVDVFATFGSGADALTVPVVGGVTLVGLEPGRGRFGETSAATLTVALDRPADVVALAHAVSLAKLIVVRATGAPSLPSHLSYHLPGPGAGDARGP